MTDLRYVLVAGRGVASSSMPRPATALLTTLGAILLTGLGGVAAVGLHNGVSPVHVTVVVWVTGTYTVSGLVAWPARPGNRSGPLMVVPGAPNLVSALSWTEQGFSHTV